MQLDNTQVLNAVYVCWISKVQTADFTGMLRQMAHSPHLRDVSEQVGRGWAAIHKRFAFLSSLYIALHEFICKID